jgi:hypothetical protein
MSGGIACSTNEGGFLHHQVTPMDNLVALSVKYGVSVSAIKRTNPFLLLGHQIPPTTKTLKIPVKQSSQQQQQPVSTSTDDLQPGEEVVEEKELDPVEEMKQSDANVEYFAVKGLTQRCGVGEKEALFMLQFFEGDVDKAREALKEKKEMEKVSAFCEKVHGECTVEEAEHWLKLYRWDVGQAAFFYKRHLKKQNSKSSWKFW